jgi:hypothetical protein
MELFFVKRPDVFEYLRQQLQQLMRLKNKQACSDKKAAVKNTAA